MTTPHLVLFDADRIKDYVFATGRLKEIRGASEQVRRLTDYHDHYRAPTFERLGLPHWEPGATEGVIYASGGAGAVLLPTWERAAALCEELERDFRHQTAGATLSAVWEPVAYERFRRREEAEAAAQHRAAQKLARRKASRPQAELLPGGGAIRFCGSDRFRPASSRIAEPGGGSLFASESTANKRHKSKLYRSPGAMRATLFWQAFERALGACAERAREAGGVEVTVNLDAWREAVHADQDLGSLSASASPSGYVALVYVDGDGVGRKLRDVVARSGFNGYQRFSRALTVAATGATAEALAAAYYWHEPPLGDDPDDPEREARFLPFEVITIGGDDVIVICTGEHGLAVAHTICKRFGPLLREAMPVDAPELTASAGVVIAHDSLPIVQLERRGRELLRSAKKLEGGGVDFHIVSTPAMDDLGALRARDYGFEGVALTARPYSLTEIGALIAHARTLRSCELSGSKRADLYLAAHGERVQATLDVLMVQTRLREPARGALIKALYALGCGLHYPFRLDEGRDPAYSTALLDLLEAMEFVAEEGQWEPSSARR
jgi:hypothetical protein